jgi:hypothetical protein
MSKPSANVPRWRRKKKPQPVIHLPRRERKRLVREVVKATAQTPGTGTPQAAAVPVPGPHLIKAGFRWRRHLVPFEWLAALLATGFILHAGHAVPAAIIISAAAAVLIVLLCRHLSDFARKAALAIGCLTALWLPLIAAAGKPCAALALICWVFVTVPWVKHYRWRPQETPAAPSLTDHMVWAKLAAKRRWSGQLGQHEDIPGGARYPIILDGSETDIGEVIAHPRKIAAAWAKPITEAYVEPSPDGVESRGILTILRQSTLTAIREWDGAGVDPEDGTAVIGRYADGAPASIRLFARRDGIRHGIIAGTTGAGKTVLLDLLIRIALTTGYIIPVILDPQEGQSLPQWRDILPYAAGVPECAEMLELIHEGMLSRSRYLGSLTWNDDGHPMRGMNFYDAAVTGLPIIMTIGDEYPVLLTDRKYGPDAARHTAGLSKLGRKSGFSLWPVAQVPSLSELQDQVVRSMLVGGNVICLRTGDRVSAGMLGLPADPSELPRYFPDGQPTYGLGYVLGPDNRQAVARVDLPGRATRNDIPQLPPFDDRLAAIMGRFGSAVPPPLQPTLSAVPPAAPAADDDSAPEGRTAADAILAVLAETGRETDRGEILKRTGTLVTQEWGREKAFSMRAIGLALEKLTADGKIVKPGKNAYHLPKPVLERVK